MNELSILNSELVGDSRMKFLSMLLLNSVLGVARTRLLNRLGAVGNSSHPEPELTVKMKLITDIIAARQGRNIVIIAHLKDITDIPSIHLEGTIKLEPIESIKETLGKLKLFHMKDNRPSFYMILPSTMDTDDEIKSLLSLIQDEDSDAEVTIIYNDSVDVENLYKDKKIYNIYVFNPDNSLPGDQSIKDNRNSVLYRMFTICRFCSDGHDTLDMVNTWRYTDGFRRQVQFKMSFTGNFHKANLTMGVDENYPPDFFTIRQDKAGNNLHDGYRYRYYIAMGNILNLTWRFLPNRYGDPWFFDSYLTDLLDDHIDVIGSAWRGRYDRFKAAGGMSTPYFISNGKNIISIEPSKGVQSATVYKALDIYTWLFLFSCVPFCGIALYLSRAFGINADREANIWECSWEAITILCWDSVTIRRAPWSVMFIFGTYMFMAFITISEYFGMYTAIIAIAKYETPPIDTIEQLWESKDLKWISDYPSTTEYYIDYFGKSGIDIKDRLYEPKQVIDDDLALAALKQVKKSKGQLVYFEGEGFANYYIKKYSLEGGSKHKYYFSKEQFDPSFSVLYFTTPCYFSEYLNRAILLFRDMYIDELIDDRYDVTSDIQGNLKAIRPPTDYGLIQLKHLVTAATIIGGVGVVSLLSLITEIVYNYVKERFANQH